MATCGAVVDAKLPNDAAEDSFNMLPALLDQPAAMIQPDLLEQAFGGERGLSIRRGGTNYDLPLVMPLAMKHIEPTTHATGSTTPRRTLARRRISIEEHLEIVKNLRESWNYSSDPTAASRRG